MGCYCFKLIRLLSFQNQQVRQLHALFSFQNEKGPSCMCNSYSDAVYLLICSIYAHALCTLPDDSRSVVEHNATQGSEVRRFL